MSLFLVTAADHTDSSLRLIQCATRKLYTAPKHEQEFHQNLFWVCSSLRNSASDSVDLDMITTQSYRLQHRVDRVWVRVG